MAPRLPAARTPRRKKPPPPPPVNTENHTPGRLVRVPDDEWARFGEFAAPFGGRSTVIRRLMKMFAANAEFRETIRWQDDPTGDRPRRTR